MHYIFLTSWFIFTLSIAWIKDYKPALICNIIATLSFSIYCYIIDELLVSVIFLIASLNGLIQFILPKSKNLKIIIIRNLIAIIIALTASAFLYKTYIDLLPCIGFICARLGEAQQNRKVLMSGIIVAMLMLALFGILKGLYFMVFFQAIVASAFIYKLISHKSNP